MFQPIKCPKNMIALLNCYVSISNPFVQTGMQYIKIPKENDKKTVMIAYAYALIGRLLSLIALNSAANVETVLRHPIRPNCSPATAVSQSLVFTYIKPSK